MNTTHQVSVPLVDSNPFMRGYHSLDMERLLQITYDDYCPPCFRPLHHSQAHLSDGELQLSPCVFNDDFALISASLSIPNELDECCQSTGLVRQVVYALTGERLNQKRHVGDLYSLEEAQAVIHHLSFETGHYSRSWEISTVHLPAEAMSNLQERVYNAMPKLTSLFFELFKLPDCDGIGCKLIGTPWTDEQLLKIGGRPYPSLRQEQLDAGTPEALVHLLYLAALADVRILILDPYAAVLPGLAVFDK